MRRSGPRTSCGRGLCVAFVARRLARPSGRSRLFPGRSQRVKNRITSHGEVQRCRWLEHRGRGGSGGLCVDDFEAISLSEVPLGVEGVGQAGSSGASQSPSTSESDTTTSFQHTKQSQAQARPRTTSKTSRRSRKSLRRDTELRLILDFPLRPTFIPSPTKSRTPSSALPPPEVTPIHDDGSVFYARDSFRGIHSRSGNCRGGSIAEHP
ncbi:hypothetical protein F5148DRAFT_87012 [Russula earlei]|uniref:Uncharacterized protein n=1 Tax=Russula earlei TaxID=71964 RepID=A0ACC0U848_9AGAM|nr:hypothetical protein F5148DRAFT_87012 [Russula earlei]